MPTVSTGCALHRLRGVFLTSLGADKTQIEASFREAIRIAKQQKAVSLTKCAKGEENAEKQAVGRSFYKCDAAKTQKPATRLRNSRNEPFLRQPHRPVIDQRQADR
jgi:hypothetical protein